MSVRRAAISFLLTLIAVSSVRAQAPDAGRQVFVARCAGCHGSDGNGGELGPGIATRVPLRSDADLAALLRQGLPGAGMPSFGTLTEQESADVVRFLRTLRPRAGSGPERAKVTLDGGRMLEGLVLNRSANDMQLLGDDQALHLLRRNGNTYRQVDVADGLDELQRPGQRQPLQPAHADLERQRREAHGEMDLQPAEHGAAAGHAGRRGRRDVRDERERVLRARRGHGPADLAVSAAAHEGPHRQRRRRRQSRRVGRRRQGLHGDGSRARHRARPHDRRAALGHRDGRLAPELQRDRRSAAGRQPRRHRHVRRRRGRARIPGGVRSGDRQGSVALLDGAEARRAGIGNVAGKGHRSSRRNDVADGDLRSGARYGLLAGGQPRPRSHRRRSARRQPLHGFDRRARREDRRGSSGTSSSRRTTSGITTRRRRPRSSTRPGRDSRENCSCRPTATASSTCSIAPTARSCRESST